MTRKNCLITGSTSGIGFIAARELARNGWHMILHARNKEKAEQTKQQIIQETGNQNVDILLADMSSLDQVKKAADEIKERLDHLDILINNAGLILGSERQLSEDGYEKTVAINHLAPFLLTAELVELLEKSNEARIINVASEAYRAAAPDFEDFNMETSYSGWKAYGNSKLYNIMFTEELAERVKSYTNILTYSLHPGTVATNFSESAGGLTNFVFKLMRPFISTPEQGAETMIYLASEEHIPAYNGAYFINKKPAKVNHNYFTPENNRRLWEISEQLVGCKFLSEEEKVR